MSSKLPQQLSQLTEAVEQLQESVSPTDIKLLNQRCWLLQQQHSDLQHQLDIRFKITEFSNENSFFKLWPFNDALNARILFKHSNHSRFGFFFISINLDLKKIAFICKG